MNMMLINDGRRINTTTKNGKKMDGFWVDVIVEEYGEYSYHEMFFDVGLLNGLVPEKGMVFDAVCRIGSTRIVSLKLVNGATVDFIKGFATSLNVDISK